MRRHAMLPESMEGRTISGMLVGESAFTLPWAMWADEDRRLWLSADYPADEEAAGTVRMRITRTPDGFQVWPVRDHEYHPGSNRDGGLPVTELMH
ncbi:hypothetical protein ABZ609_03935 [Streptomyces rubiginosohelvolus]|uniref:hypothetical protein n=1 Tax=Streptomyces rubiginosohelvolus TaxID=67362 RepID=UPI003410B5AE